MSLVAVGLLLAVPLFGRCRTARARSCATCWPGAWVPVIGLMLLFALQEVHVIVVKHEADGDAAGSYAVAAVAAKAIIWVAVGLGMYLLPEAARRVRGGEDARPILLRTLALIAAAAVPMVLIYAVAAKPLLGAVFGDDLDRGGRRAAVARARDGAARVRLPRRPVPARDRASEASSACSRRPPPWRCSPCSSWAPTSPALRSRCSASSCSARHPCWCCRCARRLRPRRDSVSAQPLERPRGARRFVVLFRLWRREAQDPEPFYTLLAAEAAEDFERRYGPLRGQRDRRRGLRPRVLHAGAARARRRRDPGGQRPGGARAGRRPARERDRRGRHSPAVRGRHRSTACSARTCWSTHPTRRPWWPSSRACFAPAAGATCPGPTGTRPGAATSWRRTTSSDRDSARACTSAFTASPASTRTARRCWAVHVGQMLRFVRGLPGVEIERVEPRYWPRLTFIARIPLVREVFMWNCVIRMRKLA